MKFSVYRSFCSFILHLITSLCFSFAEADAPQQLSYLLSQLSRDFPALVHKFDIDGSEGLSRTELQKAYFLPTLKSHYYESIEVLLANFDQLQNDQEITSNQVLSDTLSSIQLNLSGTKNKDIIWKQVQSDRDPYAFIFPNGLESISPYNIHQGAVPDCVLMASIASLAKTPQGKRKIMNMIRYDNHTVSVTFPGFSQVLEVDLLSILNSYQIFSASTQDNGLWLNILEDAYSQLTWAEESEVYDNDGLYYLSNYPFEPMSLVHLFQGSYKVLDGLNVHYAIKALTNRQAQELFIHHYSTDQLRKVLIRLNETSTIITTSPAYLDDVLPELAKHHSYSILGYNPYTDQVIIRNPWGDTSATWLRTIGVKLSGHKSEPYFNDRPLDGKDDGLFSLPLDRFKELFWFIRFDGNDPSLSL